MSDSGTHSKEDGEAAQPRWVEDTQEALNRTIDALQVAWDTTRDTRLAALNSAKRTVAELTEALEAGIAAANARWAETQHGSAESDPESEPTGDTGDDEL